MEVNIIESVNPDDYEILIRKSFDSEYASYCPQLNYMLKGKTLDDVRADMEEYIYKHIESCRPEPEDKPENIVESEPIPEDKSHGKLSEVMDIYSMSGNGTDEEMKSSEHMDITDGVKEEPALDDSEDAGLQVSGDTSPAIDEQHDANDLLAEVMNMSGNDIEPVPSDNNDDSAINVNTDNEPDN